MDGLTGIDVVLALAIVVVGTAVQGTVGFGFALVAAPVLAIIDTRFAPGPIVFAGLLVAAVYAFVERADLDLGEVKWILAGRVPGTALGALAVAALSRQTIVVGIAVFVLAAVALSLAGAHVAATPGRLFAAGTVSGVMGTTASIGGPPVALVYQRQPGPKLRSTLASYFVVGAAMSLAGLALSGEFTGRDLQWGALLAPAVMAGALASRWTAPFVDRSFLRPAVLAVAAVSALALLVTVFV